MSVSAAIVVRVGALVASNWKKILTTVLIIIGAVLSIPILILTLFLPSTKPEMVETYKKLSVEPSLNWLEVCVYDMGKHINSYEKLTEQDIFESTLDFYDLYVIKYVEEEKTRTITSTDSSGKTTVKTETYYEWVKVSSNTYTGVEIINKIKDFTHKTPKTFSEVEEGVSEISGFTETINGKNYKYGAYLKKLEFNIVVDRLDDDMSSWIYTMIDSGLIHEMFGEEKLISNGNIEEIIANSEKVGFTRENIVDIAKSLIGKFTYIWGGKATPPEVPVGLDCSGFTKYVFLLASGNSCDIGDGTYGQWANSYPITKDQLKPGDLAFKQPAEISSDNNPNHVGIFVGYVNGEAMFVHCSGGQGSVMTNAAGGSFHYFRRPNILFREEQEEEKEVEQ